MIPYGRQDIDESDIEAVAEVLRSDFLTCGPAVREFESVLETTLDVPYALACANGTAALHLAMMAAQIGQGDTVIVPSLTFLASANAARYAGAEVGFADVDPETGLLTPATFEAALERYKAGKPRGVVAVHLNGACADMRAISDIARAHGMYVIEDACHAFGGWQELGGKRARVGSAGLSDMACFSFHPVKAIAMGEGGAVTTRNPEFAARVKLLRSHGMERDPAGFEYGDEALDIAGNPNPWYYEMPEPGYNYRASDIHCALGSSQLRRLEAFLARRRQLASLYDRLLAPLAPRLRPVPRAGGEMDGWHLYAVLIQFGAIGRTRADVMHELRARGIMTQVHYIPVHRQPYYRKRYPDVSLPGADQYYAHCLTLPLYPAMTDDDAAHVAHELGVIIAGKARTPLTG